ncbi:hypothetical protein JIR001_31050 [Polycladomyces abyssicola]|uniref:Uncharacterized protein n=1 Tax=Polycladomyces abyssicola TaxID=1125966 RepID=A0A8D5UH40_9BACL|nr:hypothetical protein JIR001_31050 [Polycladomyces abyssicola]
MTQVQTSAAKGENKKARNEPRPKKVKEHVLKGELSRIVEELLFAYVTNQGNKTVSVINTGFTYIYDTKA